jgi:hypothetical protein
MRSKQVVIAIVLAALFVLIFIRARVPVSTSRQPRNVAPVEKAKKAGPPWAYPDPTRTPGFPNPKVTQANIGGTICNPEWNKRSIRPPSPYTAKLKRQQIREWGLPGTPADYEEDHLISLELGGSPKDPRNLWPEPYAPDAGAKQKDVVENYLHERVCSGAMTLDEAQRVIVTDWYRVYLEVR